MPFQACTIISRSYLAQARVLYRSFRKFHPDIPFSVLVFDAAPGTVNEPFETFTINDIGVPPGEEGRMPMLYNVTELATALKPWFFRHLLARQRSPLLYFDPDIQIFSPVERLADLAVKHCLVLTPHTTQPMSREEVQPNETDILRAGAYNLGFLGLNPDSDAFLDWWGQRLLREALIDFANNRFTDQRWMDFAPGYFDTCILKDETCNVAYWNADSRPLQWTGQHYQVNGEPLCFFHFSGFRPEVPHQLSLHQGVNPRTLLSEHPAIERLCREYTAELKAAGYDELHNLPYGFDRTSAGMKITSAMRYIYRTALQLHEDNGAPAPPNPFSDPELFVAWLNEPLYPEIRPEVTRYFAGIHAMRPDLQAAFPNLYGKDWPAYYRWLRDPAQTEVPIPLQLLPARIGGRQSTNGAMPEAPPSRGINLVGYLRAELGLGESSRLIASALTEIGEKVSSRVWSGTKSRQEHPWTGNDSKSAPYDTNLICINADQVSRFGREAGREFFQDRYNIGVWFWEAEIFPQVMHSGFEYVHEVWVASDFIRKAISKVAPLPVATIAQPLNINPTVFPKLSRADLSLPEGFLFLFSFDFFSIVERKNPMGVIRAFQKAFRPNEGPILVIKSINGHHRRADLDRLRLARDGRTDIIIWDGYVSASDKEKLAATCDCYVSLHRAEGFGLTLAEAMLREKPTIATRYSGNLEFMTDANSFLCGYKMCNVGPESVPYPAEARWADPDIDEAAGLMRFVYENPEEARRRGKQARQDLCTQHSPAAAGASMERRLSKLRQQKPAPVLFSSGHIEFPPVKKLRTAIEQEPDVRRMVPSFLTWILQGPRRAMKRCLRAYDQHLRHIGRSAVQTLNEMNWESHRERQALTKELDQQQDEIHCLREELDQTRRRLSALEDHLSSDSGTETNHRADVRQSNHRA